MHRAAAGDEVDGVHEVVERTESDAGAVRRRRHDPGDRLMVVAAHLPQREAVAIQVGIELLEPDPRLGANDGAALAFLAQEVRLGRGHVGELARLHEVARGQRGV